MSETLGKVVLVGAGPGDPELVTVRGSRAIASANVIVYDHLASAELLELAPDAERICVGKRAGHHTMPQDEINELLADTAAKGRTVVRLKGGDPYLFGRGSEEAEFLAARGIPFQIVPGIPAAVGAAACSGVPLTDRRYASSVVLVTGHEDPDKADSSINWEHIAKGAGTLVVYMGVRNLAAIADKLIQHGRAPETPASVIERATTPAQRTVRGTLADIGERAKAANVQPPAIVIIGEVNELGPALGWFESRPLSGKTIVVTRARAQASELAAQLRGLGADVLEAPAIKLLPPDNWHDVDNAINALDTTDWVVFTSASGVGFFMRRLSELGGDARRFAAAKIAVVGPGTARELAAHGLCADVQPETYVAGALAGAIQAADDLLDKRVLLARSDIARDALPTALANGGANVTDLTVYRTVPDEFDVAHVTALAEEGRIDAVTFTSSSTVEFFVRGVGEDFVKTHAGRIAAVSIGPITSAALRARGIKPAAEAADYTIPGLVRAVLDTLGPAQ